MARNVARGVQAADSAANTTPSMFAALRKTHALALRSAMHTLPDATAAACHAADEICVQAWAAHAAARQQVVHALSAYLHHVPKLPDGGYVATTSHAAWLQVLGGVQSACDAAIPDECGIAQALRRAPLLDGSAAAAAMAPLLACIAQMRSQSEAIAAADDDSAFTGRMPGIPHSACRQLLSTAGSDRAALRQGIAFGAEQLAALLSDTVHAIHRHQSHAGSISTGSSAAAAAAETDPWGVQAAVEPAAAAEVTLPELDARTHSLVIDNSVTELLSDASAALQRLSRDQDTSAALGSLHAQSALLAAEPRVEVLEALSAALKACADSSEHFGAVQACAAHVVLPALQAAARAPLTMPVPAQEGGQTVNAVALVAEIYQAQCQPVRDAIAAWAAQERKAHAAQAGIQDAAAAAEASQGNEHSPGLQQGALSGPTADLARSQAQLHHAQMAVARAVDNVHSAVATAAAQLSDVQAMSASVQAQLDQLHANAVVDAVGSALDVGQALQAANVEHGLRHSLSLMMPLVQSLHRELANALPSSALQGAEAGLKTPAAWHAGKQPAPAPPVQQTFGMWGDSNIWGGTSQIDQALFGQAELGLSDAAPAQPDSAPALAWPQGLAEVWTPVAALLSVDAVLQSVVTSPTEAGDCASKVEAALASVTACGPVSLAAAHLSAFSASFNIAPVAASAAAPPAVANLISPPRDTPQARELPNAPPVWATPPRPPSPPRLQSLGAVARPHRTSVSTASASDAALAAAVAPQGRHDQELQAFTFFDDDLPGADIMLGGLSDDSSVEAQSVGDEEEPDYTAGDTGKAADELAQFGFVSEEQLPGSELQYGSHGAYDTGQVCIVYCQCENHSARDVNSTVRFHTSFCFLLQIGDSYIMTCYKYK